MDHPIENEDAFLAATLRAEAIIAKALLTDTREVAAKMLSFAVTSTAISFEEYAKNPRLNHSTLESYRKTAAHGRYYELNGIEETAALKFGRCVHTAILEPSEYPSRVAVSPVVDRRTKEGKALWERFTSVNSHLEIITAEDNEAIEKIQEAVWSKDKAREFLVDALKEFSIYFRWEEVDCKARLDAYHESGVALDIKTTLDASAESFARDIAARGYHRKAAFYLDALEAANLQANRFLFIAVEKSAPYGVAIYELDNDAIEQGRRENAEILARYKEAKFLNEYPDYPDEIRSIALPRWAQQQC